MDDRQNRIAHDAELAARCLRGEPDAWRSLREGLQETLKSILIARGATGTEAADLLGDVWADCLGARDGHAPLLCKYQGRSALVSWLATVATHRLVDLKRRQKFVGELAPAWSLEDGESAGMMDSFSAVPEPLPERDATDEPLLALMRRALLNAISQCELEARIMLRLVYLERISQRAVARMWGWNESKISRALEAAMSQIRARALQEIKVADPWLELSWTDFLELCESSETPLL